MQRGYDFVLSIAGFDPSAGAGVLADIKTFEALGVYGCGITTATTWQNDIHFEGLEWLPFGQIARQFKALQERFRFQYVKIGLIESLEVLTETIHMLKEAEPGVRIIWDPILKASAGFDFHKTLDHKALKELLPNIFLLTPNMEEVLQLGAGSDPIASAKELAIYTQVLLKGGHSETDEACDYLFINGECIAFTSQRIVGAAKHGSGCVLSAAITAYLYQGYSLQEACRKAKAYTAAFLQSTDTLLGTHQQEKIYAPLA